MATKSSYKKAKEPVRIRERKLAGGTTSLYLDIYVKGDRKTESLHLYLLPEKSHNDKIRNKQTLMIAEQIKAKRIVALQSCGVQDFDLLKERGITLVDYLKKYESQKGNISASTTRGRRDMRKRIEDYLDSIERPSYKLGDVDMNFCRNFLNHLRNGTKKSCKHEIKPINQGCMHHIQTVFAAALNNAVRTGRIQMNPMQKLSASEKFKPQESSREYLTIDELHRLIETPCDNKEVKNAFLFSCFTGLRKGDIGNLRWTDITDSPDNGTKVIRVKMLKTQKWIHLPLSEGAMKFLTHRKDKEALIFRLPTATNITKHIVRWVKSAGITKHITFHCARHTFATAMLTLDVDLYTVSKLLGHSKVTTTQIYTKVVDSKKEDAVNRLANIFG